MAKLEFGVSLPADLTAIPAFAREAEQLGFDYLTCGEHVMFHGPIPNAFIALSVAAGATERIKLLSSGTVLPLYPAVLAAKLASVLDVASGGRFNLGVGVGGEFPREFEACGVPVNERGARTNEALEIINRLMTEDDVTFEGRFNHFHHATIRPKPIQQPRTPIWVAGRQDAAMRRAARYADVWMPYMYAPEQLARSVESIRGYTTEYGRQPDAVRSAIYAFTTVYPDSARAKQTAATFVGNAYQQDFTRLVDRYLIAGSPEECRKRLEDYAAAGAESAMLTLACPPEDAASMLRLVAEEVVPAFRASA